MKLTQIVERLRKEGIKVNFDSSKKPTSIDASDKPIPDEQLKVVNEPYNFNSTGDRKWEVIHALQANEDRYGKERVKDAQDIIKSTAQLIDTKGLKDIIQNSLGGEKYDYIAVLGSGDNLNGVLMRYVNEVVGPADIIEISKFKYDRLEDAIDWERAERDQQKTLENYKEKVAKGEVEDINKGPMLVADLLRDRIRRQKEQGPGPYTLMSTGQLANIRRYYYTKYELGSDEWNPNFAEYYKTRIRPAIYDVFMECLREGSRLLIVDDNISSGTDFRLLFAGLDNIADKLLQFEQNRYTAARARVASLNRDIQKMNLENDLEKRRVEKYNSEQERLAGRSKSFTKQEYKPIHTKKMIETLQQQIPQAQQASEEIGDIVFNLERRQKNIKGFVLYTLDSLDYKTPAQYADYLKAQEKRRKDKEEQERQEKEDYIAARRPRNRTNEISLRKLLASMLNENTNVKTVKITIPNEQILRRINSTPTFSRLSRLKLKVGDNIERVNHKQYSDMVRLYPLLNVTVQELDNEN